jgi:bifunctional non-homologous end joining protein LigD
MAAMEKKSRQLAISNPDKVLYPAGRFTKQQVVEYYLHVARWLLPHLKQRQVTLKRFPEGVRGEFFYEKDAPSFTPDWVQTFPVPRREGGPPINYILINDARTLGWAANIAALELHPFLHRVPKIEQPTSVVFDLDPGEGADVLNCCEIALLLRDVFAGLKLKSLAKVSGSKGIQVYVPLNTATTYDVTQRFARTVAELLEREHPKLVVADMSKNLRVGKVFIDWSQNADHKTTVGVYSLRAKRDRPYVSMPVKWSELNRTREKKDADALNFTPDAALKRLAKVGDLFAPVLKLKQNLPAAFGRARPLGAPSRTARRSVPTTLREYDAKRRFDETSEPAPEPRRSRQGGRRRFVVQKHAASHLHYDFRLEMHDVLKSWAVPRGVPLAAGEVHSAFETEDHPIDYLQFEGIIPEGQYGGGTVMVWDIGTYDMLEGNYWKGALKIFLSGKKLKGEWTLTRGESESGKTKWLLVKSGGAGRRIAAKQLELSAISGRTMEQIAGERAAVWQSNRAEEPGKRRTPNVERPTPKLEKPKFVPPMKATPVDHLPSGDDWIYEVKWDGYRVLAIKAGDDVHLRSLKDRNLNSDFPTVREAIGGVSAETALIDGEVVAVNAEGKPSFQMLQNRASLGREWQIVYYAFDLLQLDGRDLKREPLDSRKRELRRIVENSAVLYSAELNGTPDEIVHSMEAAGLEGVIAKRRDSRYQPRGRTSAWMKLRLGLAQEFVIGGYNPDASTFQSLLVGYYVKGELMFAGKVRQGFNPASRKALMKELAPLETKHCPFANLPSSKESHFGEGVTADDMKKLKWLKPKLVAQVRFAEWTSYGLLRHATFLGLRDDKGAREVVRES